MDGPVSYLDLVEQRTAALMSQRLRSDSIVIARLRTSIEEAQRLGHSHRSIHEAINAGGLKTSWNNYRVFLGRARKAQRERMSGIQGLCDQNSAPHDALALNETAIAEQLRTEEEEARACPLSPVPASSATHVMDALRRAREVASKDYSRIAREHYRKARE